MAAAEQARELLAQPGVDALEGILEARARLLVDAAHRILQRGQRRVQVGELPVQVFLALGVLAQFIDRRKIDLPELLDLGARLGEGGLPFEHAGLGGKTGEHARQIGAGLGELLGQRRTPHVRLLGGQPRGIHRLARRVHAVLGREPLLIECAQRSLGALQRLARHRQFSLDGQPQREGLVQSRLRLDDRFVAGGQLRLEFAAPARQLRVLLVHAPHADGHGTLGRAARLHAHVQVTRGQLCRLRGGACGLQGAAALLALADQAGVLALQLRQLRLGARQLLAGTLQRLLRGGALACQLAGVLLQALATLVRLCRAAARGLQCRLQVGMRAVRAG